MSHDYAPLPSQDGTELRRRSHVSDGVGEGFSLYTVSSSPPATDSSLRSMPRRAWACVRALASSAAAVALLVASLLVGAFYFYSLARSSLDTELSEKQMNHVRAPWQQLRAHIIYILYS
jgi:hypothetical protein